LHHISKPHLPHNPSPTAGWAATSSLMIGGGILLLALGLILKRRKSAGASLFATWLPGCNWASSGYYHLLACELQAGLDLMYCLRHRTIPSGKLLGLLDITGPVIQQLNQMTLQTRVQLQQGIALSKALQEAGAPGFLVRQSQLAEQTGNLADCFLLASKVHEMQAREAQNRLQSVLPSVALALAAISLALAYQSTLAPLYNNLTGLS
ncbi:MAG TPA: type II secretion system F family protein, partial [Limnobacter sp.]|nr:type II secretion system F family protein [Limnobacter sp.]